MYIIPKISPLYCLDIIKFKAVQSNSKNRNDEFYITCLKFKASQYRVTISNTDIFVKFPNKVAF